MHARNAHSNNTKTQRTQVLSFNDIDQILCDSHRMTLVGWQQPNGQNDSNVDIVINPLDKDKSYRFRKVDLLIVL